ncbi:MAG: helix-turn-helix domain-containing protein [Muribaculaceae bacterium]|nr:helix-turn-helix domain-containing protein [Muribaculaceae bacterium]
MIKKNLSTNFKSKATVVDASLVKVIAIDNEIFDVICQIGIYDNEDTRRYQLHVLEAIFDKNFSDDKEQMINNIWRDSVRYGVYIQGMSSGDRQGERIRIGKRIRQIREDRHIDARDLAKLANIDAANLSRIENGKYSVGLDILSKIAVSLGKKIDFIDL